MPFWAAVGGRTAFGGVMGYVLGNWCKQVSDEIILYTGCAAMLVGGLHYMRWITINWKQIDNDALGLYNRAKEEGGEGLFEKVKQFALKTAPLIGGFSAGFYAGFSMG